MRAHLNGGLFFFLITSTLYARPGFYEPWGKDNALQLPSAQETCVKQEPSFAAKIAERIIRFHQEVISPVQGTRSHFRPSSSRYMQLAIQRYGFLRGYVMGCDRLLRENNEEWVYRKVEENGFVFKYDPALLDKFR